MRKAGRLFAALGFAVAFACSPPAEETVEEPVVRPVRFVEVEAIGGVRTRRFSGGAKAGTETQLSFKAQGTIEVLPVNVGDSVRAGALIAQLDPRDYELRVEQTEASLAQARAQAVNADAEFGRIRALFERDNASRGDYDSARARSESAAASVRAVEKQLEQATLQVDYTTLRSPIDGAVAEVLVEVNENVTVGKPIVVLTAGLRPEVEIPIPEVLIGDISQGDRVPNIRFDAIPDRTFSGVIAEVAVSTTRGLTTYPVTIQLSQLDSRILPGMAAEVILNLPVHGDSSRPLAPPHAVGEDREGRFVFVIAPEDGGFASVERRSVEVGDLTTSPRFGDALEILSGLSGGERIVSAGVSKITDGQRVRLEGEDSL